MRRPNLSPNVTTGQKLSVEMIVPATVRTLGTQGYRETTCVRQSESHRVPEVVHGLLVEAWKDMETSPPWTIRHRAASAILPCNCSISCTTLRSIEKAVYGQVSWHLDCEQVARLISSTEDIRFGASFWGRCLQDDITLNQKQ
jgi:hypothetical protein